MKCFDNRCRVSLFTLAFLVTHRNHPSIAQTVSLVRRERNNATFLCESSDGTPLSNIQWWFNGSGHYSDCLKNAGSSSILEMKVSPTCEGNIQCGGQNNAKFELSIPAKPVYGKSNKIAIIIIHFLLLQLIQNYQHLIIQ